MVHEETRLREEAEGEGMAVDWASRCIHNAEDTRLQEMEQRATIEMDEDRPSPFAGD